MSIIVMISSPDWPVIKLAQLCLVPHSSYGCDDLWPSDSSHHNQENLELLDVKNYSFWILLDDGGRQ